MHHFAGSKVVCTCMLMYAQEVSDSKDMQINPVSQGYDVRTTRKVFSTWSDGETAKVIAGNSYIAVRVCGEKHARSHVTASSAPTARATHPT